MMKIIFINHYERSSVTKRIQESNRKGRDSGQESAIPAVVTCHHCKKTGDKIKYCKLLTELDVVKSDKFNNDRNKWCKYFRSDSHSNEDSYQQKPEAKSGNLDNGRKSVVVTTIMEVT